MVQLALTEEAASAYKAMLLDELTKLDVFNCACCRLTLSATQAWINAGRPRFALPRVVVFVGLTRLNDEFGVQRHQHRQKLIEGD